ncbi:hypothetical protein JZU46_05230 [bacterium]|nr:hypothetical protein [bacterium]
MSLLFFDGFTNYTYLPLKWEECTKNNQFSIKSGISRTNDKALCIYSGLTNLATDHLGKLLSSNVDTVIIGFAFKKIKADYGFIEIDFNVGDTIQSKIKLYSTNFVWFKGDETINYGLNSSLQFNNWNYFEAKIKTHTTLGTVDIRINEKVALSLTNISTATTAYNYIDRIRLRLRHIAQTNEDYAYISDLYIADTLGTYNNNFLGNCTVANYYPSSQGTFSNFSLHPTTSGVANYTMINEQIYAEDTTIYNNTFLEYASGDDGYFSDNNVANTTSTIMDVYFSTNYYPSCFWCRFSNVSIPRNAKIIKANIQFAIEYNQLVSFSSYDLFNTIYGFQKSGTPVAQITSVADFESRPLTDNILQTRIASAEPTTQNYKDSLQELVSLDNWQEENNSVMFILSRHGYTNVNGVPYKVRTYNYSNDPYSANSPKLYVEWQLPSGASGTYVRSSNIDDKDSYRLSTLSGVPNVFAIKQNIIAKRYLDRANTDDLYLMPIITNGVTTYSGSTKLPFKDTYYSCSSKISEENPITSSIWLPTDLQNYEFGFITTYSG